MFITETLNGSGLATTTSTLSILKLSSGVILTSSTALITSTGILMRNKYMTKLKIRCTKLRDCVIVITLLYDKTLKQSIVDKKTDEKKNIANEKFSQPLS